MPRHPRVHATGLLYHVMARGNNGQKIFLKPSDYEAFLEALQVVRRRYPFYLYAYVLMSNHFHLLLEVRDAPTARIMQSLLTGYVRRFNAVHRQRGHLFQGRYKAIVCDRKWGRIFTFDSDDLNGNHTSMTDPTGLTTYTYDALNRLTSITNNKGQVTSFTYDALGRRTSMTHANGVVTSYTYDAASQLLSLGHQFGATTINSFAYTYDKVGNRNSKADNAGSANYTYDIPVNGSCWLIRSRTKIPRSYEANWCFIARIEVMCIGRPSSARPSIRRFSTSASFPKIWLLSCELSARSKWVRKGTAA